MPSNSRNKKKKSKTKANVKKAKANNPILDAKVMAEDEEYPTSRIIKRAPNGDVIVESLPVNERPLQSNTTTTTTNNSNSNTKKSKKKNNSNNDQDFNMANILDIHWDSLDPEEKKDILRIDKEEVFNMIRKYQFDSDCNCSVCGRRHMAMDQEMERIYNMLYEVDKINDPDINPVKFHLSIIKELQLSKSNTTSPNGSNSMGSLIDNTLENDADMKTEVGKFLSSNNADSLKEEVMHFKQHKQLEHNESLHDPNHESRSQGEHLVQYEQLGKEELELEHELEKVRILKQLEQQKIKKLEQHKSELLQGKISPQEITDLYLDELNIIQTRENEHSMDESHLSASEEKELEEKYLDFSTRYISSNPKIAQKYVKKMMMYPNMRSVTDELLSNNGTGFLKAIENFVIEKARDENGNIDEEYYQKLGDVKTFITMLHKGKPLTPQEYSDLQHNIAERMTSSYDPKKKAFGAVSPLEKELFARFMFGDDREFFGEIVMQSFREKFDHDFGGSTISASLAAATAASLTLDNTSHLMTVEERNRYYDDDDDNNYEYSDYEDDSDFLSEYTDDEDEALSDYGNATDSEHECNDPTHHHSYQNHNHLQHENKHKDDLKIDGSFYGSDDEYKASHNNEDSESDIDEAGRLEEGRRLIQISITKLLQSRILASYHAKQADVNRLKLLQELEDEKKKKKAKEEKKQKKREKEKEKRKQQQLAKEEEKRKKAEEDERLRKEKEEKELERREAQRKKVEESKKRKDEERRRRLEEQRKREEQQEQQRKLKEEQKRKREEEKKKKEEEQARKREEEQARKREEELARKKEEEQARKKEEEKKQRELERLEKLKKQKEEKELKAQKEEEKEKEKENTLKVPLVNSPPESIDTLSSQVAANLLPSDISSSLLSPTHDMNRVLSSTNTQFWNSHTEQGNNSLSNIVNPDVTSISKTDVNDDILEMITAASKSTSPHRPFGQSVVNDKFTSGNVNLENSSDRLLSGCSSFPNILLGSSNTNNMLFNTDLRTNLVSQNSNISLPQSNGTNFSHNVDPWNTSNNLGKLSNNSIFDEPKSVPATMPLHCNSFNALPTQLGTNVDSQSKYFGDDLDSLTNMFNTSSLNDNSFAKNQPMFNPLPVWNNSPKTNINSSILPPPGLNTLASPNEKVQAEMPLSKNPKNTSISMGNIPLNFSDVHSLPRKSIWNDSFVQPSTSIHTNNNIGTIQSNFNSAETFMPSSHIWNGMNQMQTHSNAGNLINNLNMGFSSSVGNTSNITGANSTSGQATNSDNNNLGYSTSQGFFGLLGSTYQSIIKNSGDHVSINFLYQRFQQRFSQLNVTYPNFLNKILELQMLNGCEVLYSNNGTVDQVKIIGLNSISANNINGSTNPNGTANNDRNVGLTSSVDSKETNLDRDMTFKSPMNLVSGSQ